MKIENTAKQIGIWIDHTKAHFIELTKGVVVVKTLYSDKESEVRY